MNYKLIDERDTIFARMSYKSGSDEYIEYYSRNPDKEEIDNELRNLKGLLSENSPTFNKEMAAMTKSNFHFLSQLKNFNGKTPFTKQTYSNDKMENFIKKYAKSIGVHDIKFTKTKNYHFYTHKGKNNKYGQEIKNKLKYAIVFAVEMDKKMINRAPQAEEVLEVSYGYLKAAIIGFQISYFLKHMGYQAKNNFDGDYNVILSYLARDSGLGQIGRNGLITSKEIGNRLRLGAVTTDLEINIDNPIDYGLEEFCDKCKKCATNCPSNAISKEPVKNEQFKDSFESEKCFKTWHKFGTDCGICISSCPFSQEIPFEFDFLDNKTTEKILEWDKRINGKRNYLNKSLF